MVRKISNSPEENHQYYLNRKKSKGLPVEGVKRRMIKHGYPTGSKEARLSARLFSEYGITLADYNEMLAKQNFVCLICEAPPANTGEHDARLCVDHCHNSSAIRGLLCQHCNKGLGHFRDDPALIAKALKYLQEKG